MAQVLITQSDIGSNIVIKCNSINIAGTKNNTKNPNANLDGTPVSVLTKSIENPKYVIQGVRLTDEVGTLSYTDILSLYISNYDGTNPATLTLTYDTSKIVPSLTGATTGIKVVLESFNIQLSSTDSKNAYLPIATLNFVETL